MIRLFPSLSSATQTYLVTFNLCPPVPFCFQIAALHELVPPVIALLGMTPPPGSLPPLAAVDPRIPGTTIMCIRHFTRWNFFPSFFFQPPSGVTLQQACSLEELVTQLLDTLD